ncbi:MAG: KUP/HAK/KT family potassium transporter [Planctomycetota bacterium]|nr:KUP/HAK/KT family potassium transporter [Planctomycetota bacterium]
MSHEIADSSHSNARSRIGTIKPGLVIAAVGVVFGDIGTSPLYALEECFDSVHGVAPDTANVLGVLGLVFWSLVLVIGVKYCLFLLKAHNKGEGGIFALLGLLIPKGRGFASAGRWIVLGAIAGSALLYADGVITPAISVLSAVEGLQQLSPKLNPFIVPITIAIIILIFSMQQLGTGRIGRLFGPIMLLWFIAIGVCGVLGIMRAPIVLEGINPIHALHLAQTNPLGTFLILGSVMLCVTGGEALYADLGHFGRKPMIASWYAIVLPSLLLNYFGQGAVIHLNPAAAADPFFALVPKDFMLPMIILAASAAVIASQSIITGVFSLTQGAVALGILPRLRIIHTSEHGGQVFVPSANVLCGIACVLLVITFRTSDSLAHAYGLSVAAGMVTVTLLYAIYKARTSWSPLQVWLFLGCFLTIDLLFLSASMLKIPAGGWVTILMAITLFTIMRVWTAGRMVLASRFANQSIPLDQLINSLQNHPPVRVSGTAIFLTPISNGVPPTLLHHLKHMKVLHAQVAILSIVPSEEPYVEDDSRLEVEPLREGFWKIKAHMGFLDQLDVPALVRQAADSGFITAEGNTTYFLGRTIVTARGTCKLSRLSKRLFCALASMSSSNPLYFAIPPGRMVELGIQVDL